MRGGRGEMEEVANGTMWGKEVKVKKVANDAVAGRGKVKKILDDTVVGGEVKMKKVANDTMWAKR